MTNVSVRTVGESQPFLIYQINIRCLFAHLVELCYFLDLYKPHVVLIQETWLNSSVESVKVPNYNVLSRRDRATGDNRGGIITLVRRDLDTLVHVSNSESAERSWHLLHLDIGSVAIGNWYRSPNADQVQMSSLRQELAELKGDVIGFLLVGDMNVHHQKWLRHSNSNTPEGAALKDICDDFAMKQCVRDPTRGDYLLDLVCTDLDGCKCKVLPKIADHNGVLVKLRLPIPKGITIERKVWHFRGAAWHNLRCELKAQNWRRLTCGSVDNAMDYFVEFLMALCLKYIPYDTVKEHKQTHPWLNKECEAAIWHKNQAENTPAFAQAQEQCSTVLAQAYQDHIKQLKLKISKLSKADKSWWRLNRELLDKQARVSAIPPLRTQDGKWHLDSKAKADVFAAAFGAKCSLPPMREDLYVGRPAFLQQEFIAIRGRRVVQLLAKLDVNKATGPDRLSARILKELSSVLALPLCILCRRILHEGCWPLRWRLHHIVPIYKRNAVHAAKNYRGVHLTNVMSKVAERAIGEPLIAHLAAHGYGANQWGFRKLSSSRDLTLICVSSWIMAACSGKKVGAFLCDITAAFDRVFKDFLMAKLASVGVNETYLQFLNSYLEPRMGQVTVEGAFSELIELADTVFQGTVLGPALWNVFFHDIVSSATWHGGQEAMFADDLNVFKLFDVSVSNRDVLKDMELTQKKVHRWGDINRVEMDAEKEHTMVIHPLHGEGPDFKLLGCRADVKLTMLPHIEYILQLARPKIKAMLRTRGMYDQASMLMQYKTHIWSIIEHHSASIRHACASSLARLDSLQRGFLNEMDMTEDAAFIFHNFAPPTLRRDIGMLGFLHKRVLGHCHPALTKFLPMALGAGWHDKPLQSFDHLCPYRRELFHRSLFGMIHVYNRLPQYIVDLPTVQSFQKELTSIAKRRCENGHDDWPLSFNNCSHLWAFRLAMAL